MRRIAPPQSGQTMILLLQLCSAADLAGPRCGGLVGRGFLRRLRFEKRPTALELLGAVAIGEEAVVTDAVEAVGEDVQQEAADELVRLRASSPCAGRGGDNPSSGR